MKNKMLLNLVLMILAVAFMQPNLHAQAGHGKGRLGGLVVDEAGQPLENVTVTMQFAKSETIEKTITNKKGEWSFIGLGTGFYDLAADAEGFIPVNTPVNIRQLERNPSVKLVLKEDKEKKARIRDEASLSILEQGNALFEQRKYSDALVVFNQFIQNNPEIYQIYFNIGDCYRELQDYDTAVKQYELAMEKAKAKTDLIMESKGYAAIGEIYLRKQDFKNAQKYFEQSLDLNSQDEILAYNVAEIFFNNQKVEDAIHYYTLATQIKPEWGPPYLKLGYACLNKAEYPKALENFNKFLQVDPTSDQVQTVQSLIDYIKTLK